MMWESLVMEHDDQHLRELADRVIEAEGRAVSGVRSCLDATFLTVARLLAACRGKVVVVGSGTSGAVAARAAHLFSVGGTPSFHLAPADGLHGGLGVLRRDDVVMALSKGGASKELNDFCRLARPLCGALVTVTARRESELVTLVDHAIVLNLDLDADLGGVIATGSSLAAAAALDALVEVTRLIRGYSWEQFHYTHPGGAVGQESKVSLERLSGRADGA
jgi:D-arabinose 5-phosphate isomerase GutQ